MTLLLTFCLCIGIDSPSDYSFRLQDYRGAWHEPAIKDHKATVVMFTGVECPIATVYSERFNALCNEFKSKGVYFVAIDANAQDSMSDLEHFAKSRKLDFPLLKDVGNAVADRFKAERTPEVFLIGADGKLHYRGAIDDQYGVGFQRPRPEKKYLRDAIESFLAGKEIKVAKTTPEGCIIGRVQKADSNAKHEVTYSNQISRLLQKHCVECHREGQIAPFALTNYSEVAGWAEALLENVENRRMPPWHASPEYGHFSNEAKLTKTEITMLKDWVAAGVPEGDPNDLPKPVEYTKGWRIPKPDVVFTMPTKFNVPATGEVEYKYFEVETNFTEDKWVRAAEARPGNPAVVHHIIVFVRPPNVARGGSAGLHENWLVATAPGALPLNLSDGKAKRIPKGSRLLFQMHYTPNGKAQSDQSSVGLVFADPKSVKKEVFVHRAANLRFRLEPNKRDQQVRASQKLDDDVHLLAMFPHMHLRGQAFRYEAHYPDGKKEVLLDIPAYDFAWQNTYILAEPLLLPAGTVVACTALFDNSTQNRSNPDPSAEVRWGDQTWEEMMIGYFSYSLADQDLQYSRIERFNQIVKSGGPKVTPDLKAALKASYKAESAVNDVLKELKKQTPQLDRLDLMVIDGETVNIQAASQSGGGGILRMLPRFPVKNSIRRLGPIGAKSQLAEIAERGKPVVHNDLASAKGWDLLAVSRSMGSGVHVPIEFAGKKAMINFWSRDTKAFPEEALEFYRTVVAEFEKSK